MKREGKRKSETDLNYLSRFALFPALHMFGLQIYFLDDNSATVFEDLCDLSNLTLITTSYYLHCVPNLNMHLM